MDLIARSSLVANSDLGDTPALLLEGDWPTDWAHRQRYALDQLIDVRHAHLDAAACWLVEQLGKSPLATVPAAGGPPDQKSPAPLLADVFALRLRYYVIKLLRLIAALEGEPSLQAFRRCRLIVAARGDEDLVALVQSWAARRQVGIVVERREGTAPTARPLPQDQPWRQCLGRVARWFDAGSARPVDRQPTVLLCGNPRHLRMVADALRAKQYANVWLYERFAARAWLSDGMRQDRQRWCDPLGTTDAAAMPAWSVPNVSWQGVNLGPAIAAGFFQGAREQWQWAEARARSVDRVFEEESPLAVVLDEDATPFARLVIRTAQQRQIATFVVQHGAPYVRFGFAPPAADQLLVWGRGTQARLEAWGVVRERITVVGCPWWTGSGRRPLPARQAHSHTRSKPRSANSVRFLLLATVPPRDHRPDAVSFHLTTTTYRRMLQAVAEVLASLPGARLTVRLHPRGQGDEHPRHVLEPYLAGRVQWVSGGSLARYLSRADCVLSCASSAGIEAAAAGLPVIQLLPEGSEDACADLDWGLVGTARTALELRRLLQQVFSEAHYVTDVPRPTAFAAWGEEAARRVVQSMEQRIAADPPGAAFQRDTCQHTAPRADRLYRPIEQPPLVPERSV